MESECWGVELPTGAVVIVEKDKKRSGSMCPFVVVEHDKGAHTLSVKDVLGPDSNLPGDRQLYSPAPSQHNQRGVLDMVGHH